MASAIPSNQASFSIAELIRVTGAELCVAGARAAGAPKPPADFEREHVVGVSTDTRAPLAGGLFVALRGERFDGHRFVADAERAGARVLLVEGDVAAERALVLKVPSTLRALGALGRYQRERWGGKLVAIAGSVGKTTTRSATALVLGASGACVHSPRGNLNNAIGVPLVLLGLLPEHRYAVVEIGTNLPGEVAALSALARPDVGVLTRVSLEHTEGLGDLDGIELEEGSLLAALGPGGIAIANGDDRRCQNQLKACGAGLKLSYGTSPGRDYRILECVTGSARGTRLRIQRLDGDELTLDNPLLGLPGAYALTAALAVSETLMEQRLEQASLERALLSPELGEPGRLCPLELANGALVLDDTYNASPASVLSSVEVARELASRRGGRLLLALGEMRELGALSESAHRELGEQLVDTHPALIVGFGGHAELMLRAPAARGIDTCFALDAPAALAVLAERVKAGDVILVKASRSLGAERIVRGLAEGGRLIYELLYPLSTQFGWAGVLNVLRYVPFRIIMATLTAMGMCFLLAPWFIRRLQSKQIGQVIRKDGPASHFSKAGTPTMGGALILLSVLVATMLWADVHNAFIVATAAVTAGYGLIGYLDDWLKIVKKNSKGLLPRYKMLGQVGIGGAALAYAFLDTGKLPEDWLAIRTRLSIPFLAFSKFPVELPLWLYIAFALFVVVAMSNAVNFTDGLDGLAIGPVMINAGTYLLWSYIAGSVLFGRPLAAYLDIAGIPAMGELAVYAAAVIGAGIGFLWYNTYPAQVFMGDVGSLALGGGLGMLAVLTKNELLSVLIGGIFVLEAASVVTQVASFKMFGKRVFLMAPIHHHFEKKGWAEPKIIVRFWIISILLALIGLSSLKLR